MTRRDRTQEEHATFEEHISTHIQIIVSAREASNKEVIAIIKKENEEARKTKKQEKLSKHCREISKKACRNENTEAFKSPMLDMINKCTSQTVSLFTYQTKPQQHLYKTDV